MLSQEQGNFLLKLARETVEKFVDGEKVEKPDKYPVVFDKNCGVFCTITKNGHLRGCIGMPYPLMPLIKALMAAAVSACSEDPRFPPVAKDELEKIKIEISVLTEPKLIEAKPEELPDKIEIEKDGLIIQLGPYSGLLLPQVAAEHGWSAEEFLCHLCEKAGLTPDMWKDPRAKIYKFRAQIFSE